MSINSLGVLNFSNTASDTGFGGSIAHYTNNYMYIKGGSGGLAIGDDGFDTNIYLNNSDTIQFQTGGAVRIVIDPNGSIYNNSSTGQTFFGSNNAGNPSYVTGVSNSSFGYGAGNALTSGYENTIIGRDAGGTMTTGFKNVLVGLNAGVAFTTGSRFVAIGANAAKQLVSDVDNVFVGMDCGHHRVSGIDNTFVGAYANYNGNATGCCNTGIGKAVGYELTSGVQNTFVGRQAGYSVTTANDNTMVGHNSGIYATGQGNTYVGSYTGDASNNTGGQNTGVGRAALSAITSGEYNTAIGYNAGDEATTGDYNICIGNGAGSGSSPFHLTTQSGRVVIGDNSIGNAYIKVSWTVTSDKRDKTDFGDVPHGLDFVSKLKPTSYKFKKDRDSKETQGSKRYGFLAQEVLELEGENPVIIDNTNEDKLSYTESNLVPVLVKAIQELKAEVDKLKQECKCKN